MPKISRSELKTPKGTKDWSVEDIMIRDELFEKATRIFKNHGAVQLDTPVFELTDILENKYGEDSKLIYNLADQGGERCSLRYDLTVPFARYVAQNNIQTIIRFHIAKVYRRDQPAIAKGRLREFYQCDFDIAGPCDPMMYDAEIFEIIQEIFTSLGWAGKYTIKMNHRKILDGIFTVSGVPDESIRAISSAVDKLDKLPWAEVRKEMVEEKGLDGAVADQIGQWVCLRGGEEIIESLVQNQALAANQKIQEGIADLTQLFQYLKASDSMAGVSFDLSLARGLDYYTGIIMEVVTEGSAPAVRLDGAEKAKKAAKKKSSATGDADEDRSNDPSIGVGSIAAGGRYDNLVEGFSGSKPVSCVGISFGVDRIISIQKARGETKGMKLRSTDVFVMALGNASSSGMATQRMEITSQLRRQGIRARTFPGVKWRNEKQFKAADSAGAVLSIILGEDEAAQGKLRLKRMGLEDGHPEKNGVLIDKRDVASEVKKTLERVRLEDATADQVGSLSLA